MQTTDIRYQLNIHWRKVILLGLTLFVTFSSTFAQARFKEISQSGQDDKLISYGFFLATHTNSWRLKYTESFLSEPNIQSIMPVFTPGFSLGFLATFRIHDQLNLVFTPKVAFYEFRTDINTFSNVPDAQIDETNFFTTETVINEATMVEFPIFFKYKAQRFNNSRMFFTAGGSAMFRTKDQEEADIEPIATLGRDFTVDLGLGFDMYFKYFKFSPEVRFSHGLLDMYRPEATDPAYRDSIQSLRRKSVTLYLNFQ